MLAQRDHMDENETFFDYSGTHQIEIENFETRGFERGHHKRERKFARSFY